MAIRYSLIQNKRIAGAGRCVARVCSVKTVEFEGVIERMLEHHSTVSKADTLAVLEEFFSTIETLALEGVNVNTPVAIFRSSIQGVFDGADDKFDARRHKVAPRVLPGKRLRRAYRWNARPTKVESHQVLPNPLEYADTASGTKDTVLTPCRTGRLSGYRLSYKDEGFILSGPYWIGLARSVVLSHEIT
jgi:hypothetical protein